MLPPSLPPIGQRDPGDAWVEGPDGQRFWGKFGAAGLLVWDPTVGILLQHRVAWSHFGGTWGVPGGARKKGESAEDAALREAAEEATISRLYGGIHYRDAIVNGQVQGKAVGEYIVRRMEAMHIKRLR